MVFAAIVTMWIVLPAMFISIASLSTDIIDGICIPWGVYSSYSQAKAMIASGIVLVYFLPLTAMLFCYSRIVYAIRHKVIIVTAANPSRSVTTAALESCPASSCLRAGCGASSEHTEDGKSPFPTLLFSTISP